MEAAPISAIKGEKKRRLAIKKSRLRLSEASEAMAKAIFAFSALAVALCVGLIAFYIFITGVPALFKIGVKEFLFGAQWLPDSEIFGIFPMIIGSVFTTVGAIAIGLPTGVLTAIFICEYAPKPVEKTLNPTIELLAGIPSVVYGFFGLTVIVPLINKHLGGRGAGNSLLAASIILGVMILPTVITTTQTALRAVPEKYRAGAYALGASKELTIFTVLMPAAKSGVFSGIALAIGRAVGETMAVILIAGNSVIIPKSVTDPVRTLAANIAIEMGYSSGLHQEALFATGVILFAFIMSLNVLLAVIRKGAEK